MDTSTTTLASRADARITVDAWAVLRDATAATGSRTAALAVLVHRGKWTALTALLVACQPTAPARVEGAHVQLGKWLGAYNRNLVPPTVAERAAARTAFEALTTLPRALRRELAGLVAP